MNIKGLVVAAAMMGSAAAAVGCNMPALDTNVDAADLASQVAEGAAPETANWFTWRAWFSTPSVAVARPVARTYWSGHRTRYTYVTPTYVKPIYVRTAPPPLRYEHVGRAPSTKHFYVPGYWKWNNGRHEWISGHWDLKRNGHIYVSPHWDKIGGQWRYEGGYWKRA